MGGLSSGSLRPEVIERRPSLRLTGAVRLENNGGFVQMALDLAPGGVPVDARAFRGIAVTLRGDGAVYGLHLRSTDVTRPWQSYRATVPTTPRWQRHDVAFDAFRPHRLDAPLDTARLRRIGIVAIGHAGSADVAVADLRFF